MIGLIVSIASIAAILVAFVTFATDLHGRRLHTWSVGMRILLVAGLFVLALFSGRTWYESSKTKPHEPLALPEMQRPRKEAAAGSSPTVVTLDATTQTNQQPQPKVTRHGLDARVVITDESGQDVPDLESAVREGLKPAWRGQVNVSGSLREECRMEQSLQQLTTCKLGLQLSIRRLRDNELLHAVSLDTRGGGFSKSVATDQARNRMLERVREYMQTVEGNL